MKNFEYAIVPVPLPGPIEDIVNDWAYHGWRLKQVTPTVDFTPFGPVDVDLLYFERQVFV